MARGRGQSKRSHSQGRGKGKPRSSTPARVGFKNPAPKQRKSAKKGGKKFMNKKMGKSKFNIFSAPVSRGWADASRYAGVVSIPKRTEMLSDVVTTPTFTIQSLLINPGNEQVFPWLSGIASSFQRYKFKHLAFRFLPYASSSDEGPFDMAVQENVQDPKPTNVVAMNNLQPHVGGSLWAPHTLVVKQRTPLYVKTGIELGNYDDKTYDLALFHISAVCSTGHTIGRLFVDYTIDFYDPVDAGNSAYNSFSDQVTYFSPNNLNQGSWDWGSVGGSPAYNCNPAIPTTVNQSITSPAQDALVMTPTSDSSKWLNHSVNVETLAANNSTTNAGAYPTSFGTPVVNLDYTWDYYKIVNPQDTYFDMDMVFGNSLPSQLTGGNVAGNGLSWVLRILDGVSNTFTVVQPFIPPQYSVAADFVTVLFKVSRSVLTGSGPWYADIWAGLQSSQVATITPIQNLKIKMVDLTVSTFSEPTLGNKYEERLKRYNALLASNVATASCQSCATGALTASLSHAHPFGTAPTIYAPTNWGIAQVNSTVIVYNLQQGYYEFTYALTGTGITAIGCTISSGVSTSITTLQSCVNAAGTAGLFWAVLWVQGGQDLAGNLITSNTATTITASVATLNSSAEQLFVLPIYNSPLVINDNLSSFLSKLGDNPKMIERLTQLLLDHPKDDDSDLESVSSHKFYDVEEEVKPIRKSKKPY